LCPAISNRVDETAKRGTYLVERRFERGKPFLVDVAETPGDMKAVADFRERRTRNIKKLQPVVPYLRAQPSTMLTATENAARRACEPSSYFS
jgi:hypothetical protein